MIDHGLDTMRKRYERIDKIIAVEVYLLIIFSFVTKGEAIRNILLYSGFFLWLVTLKYKVNKSVLIKPVPVLFLVFILSVAVSVIFSIDPIYSFKQLRGDPLKSIILLCLITTALADEKRLLTVIYLAIALLAFTLSQGYYSYWAYDMPLMKPVTFIRHAWHTRFAMDINTLLPFTCIALFRSRNAVLKIALSLLLVASMVAVMLSTSRGGMTALLVISLVWLLGVSKKTKINWNICVAGTMTAAVILGAILAFSTDTRKRIADLAHDVGTFHERTYIWGPLISAGLQRPVTGWGYGPGVFVSDRPFENTSYKKAPVHLKDAFRNPHNSFLKIFFHQGLMGLISYTTLLVIATISFWRNIDRTDELRSYILISCASIMTGTYFVNSIVENPHLTDIVLILGIGSAALYTISEDSHN
jgi:O-antigen ligase